MRFDLSILLSACLIAGCASSQVGSTSQVGTFVMAGPTNADGPTLSMRWQYGLQLAVDPKTISEVKFSCAPIPGTLFSAKGEELRVLKNGAAMVQGPVLPISTESTPWLFESSTTSTVCRAIVSRTGQPDTIVQAPVNFPPSVKISMLQQFKMAHEYNSKLNKK